MRKWNFFFLPHSVGSFTNRKDKFRNNKKAIPFTRTPSSALPSHMAGLFWEDSSVVTQRSHQVLITSEG